ncbi:MFS transporter [Thalassoglobus sp.]|uniref:MFS transporter n=1 Tax=Thalassoglobus sp. TaxID=2795869 RepID=UPI003AA971C7
MDSNSTVPTNRRHLVFWLASATSFFLYTHRYAWNLIRPELQKEYGLSNTALEGLGTAFYATYTLGSIPSGVVIDMFGPHIFLFVIILIWSITLPLHGVTGNLLGLGSVRLLFGAAQTGTYPALGQVTRTWFPRSGRTQIQGWVASFFGRGGAAFSSILMGTILMGFCGFSWRMALVLMSIPGIVFAGLFLYYFRNTPEDDPHTNEAERNLIRGDEKVSTSSRNVISAKVALKNLSLRIMVVQQFMNAGADVVYTLILGSFFKSLGVEKMTDLGWMVSLPLIGGAVGGVVGGILNDWLIPRLGSRWGRSLVGFVAKSLAAAALFVAISQPTPERVAVGLFFVKFFTDWTQPTVWGTATDIGGRFSATVFSIINTAGNAGGFIMPLIFGPLLDIYSTNTIVNGEAVTHTNFTPMFIIVGVFYIGAGICWLLVDCTKSVDVPDEIKPTEA